MLEVGALNRTRPSPLRVARAIGMPGGGGCPHPSEWVGLNGAPTNACPFGGGQIPRSTQAALEEKAYQAEENVLAAFHKLDLDDSGSITIANLKKLFPEDMDDAHITEMLNQFDENGDGTLLCCLSTA